MDRLYLPINRQQPARVSLPTVTIIVDARTATDHFPGIGRYVVNLARALRETAPELSLTLLRDPHIQAQRLTLPDLTTVPCGASPFSLAQQWQVPAALRHARATLYHSAYYLMPYFPGVPTVLTCYDVIPCTQPADYTAMQRLVFRVAHRLALRAARVVLAISQATKNDLVRWFGVAPAKIVVTPLAADARFAPCAPNVIESIRQQYHLPERYVLYVGSNKRHKNLARLVEAYGQSALPKQDIPLVITGHWDNRFPEAKQIAEAHSLPVRFLPNVNDRDLPALYSGAGLFIFPSLYEGFGLPVLEAMACGAPVACSNVSSLPEVAGTAAQLFDPLAVSAITDALDQALSNTAEQRAKSLSHAQTFSWEETARLTVSAYKTVVR